MWVHLALLRVTVEAVIQAANREVAADQVRDTDQELKLMSSRLVVQREVQTAVLIVVIPAVIVQVAHHYFFHTLHT